MLPYYDDLLLFPRGTISLLLYQLVSKTVINFPFFWTKFPFLYPAIFQKVIKAGFSLYLLFKEKIFPKVLTKLVDHYYSASC